MAKFKVVPDNDMSIIQKYFTNDDYENTVILCPKSIAEKEKLMSFNNRIVENPYDDGEHDISLYLLFEGHSVIKKLK